MYNELREYRFMCLGHSRNPGTLRGETSAGSPLPRAEQSKGDGCTNIELDILVYRRNSIRNDTKKDINDFSVCVNIKKLTQRLRAK